MNGRAFHRAIGTEDAAIAMQRAKHCLAVGALIEIDARVKGHRFDRHEAALRTCERRFKDDGAHKVWRPTIAITGRATASEAPLLDGRFIAGLGHDLDARDREAPTDSDTHVRNATDPRKP